MNEKPDKQDPTSAPIQETTAGAPQPEAPLAPPATGLRSGMPFISRNSWIFIIGFGLVGAIAIYLSLAAPLSATQLLSALSNFTTDKPTYVTGTIQSRYQGSAYIKSTTTSYSINITPQTGNFRLSGTTSISGLRGGAQPFNYDLRNINRQLYFKISGLKNIQKIIPKGTPLSAYFTPRYPVLAQNDNQWLTLPPSSGGQIKKGQYQCTAQPIRIGPNDAQNIKMGFLRNPSLGIKDVKSSSIGSQGTTLFTIVPTNSSALNKLANQITSLSVIRSWQNCINNYFTTNWTNSSTRSVINDTTKIYIYVTKQHRIIRIEIISSSRKSSSQIVANFGYGKPATISPVRGAKDATKLLGLFIN
jgi:hypothetical protein